MYPVSIFDSSLTLLGIIDNYEYLKFHFKHRTIDNFQININRYKNNVSYLELGNIIAVYINGSYRSGIIESKELTLTEEGKISESYTIIGRGLDGLLAERIALYATDSGTGYDSQSGYAETLMRHYVNVNCISSANTDRNYSLLELEADQERGGSVKYDGRFQYISEIEEEISLASGLGWEITLDTDNKKFKFHVYEGKDRSWENGVNSVVCFSPEFGNIKLLGFRTSRINSKNVAYVAGQGEANLRDVDEVTKDAGSFTDTGRREFLIDARDLDTTDKMLQRGNERLAEVGEETVIEMENLNTDAYRFGYEYDLGDIITVKYPEIVEMDARIIEVIMEITEREGMINKIVVGRTYPDIISILKNENKNMYPEIRR